VICLIPHTLAIWCCMALCELVGRAAGGPGQPALRPPGQCANSPQLTLASVREATAMQDTGPAHTGQVILASVREVRTVATAHATRGN